MIDYNEPIKVAEGVYWVGFYDEKANFHCNPYLLIDGSEAILIDPGSIPHFPVVARKVFSLVKPKQITKIILHHQDPDLCASVPIFEDLIARSDMKIVLHPRAGFLVWHYGVKSEFINIDEKQTIEFGDGRKLKFVNAPYLHTPGVFMTYDEKTKTLFSSDLFGAFSKPDWSLYANVDAYLEEMAAFHAPYMPSKEILAHTMSKLEKMDIDMICSQHGSIISGKENVKKAITFLKNLDCGDYLKDENLTI